MCEAVELSPKGSRKALWVEAFKTCLDTVFSNILLRTILHRQQNGASYSRSNPMILSVARTNPPQAALPLASKDVEVTWGCHNIVVQVDQ